MNYIVIVEAAIYAKDKWFIVKNSGDAENSCDKLSNISVQIECDETESEVLESNLKRKIFDKTGMYIHDEMEYLQSSMVKLDSGEHALNIVFLCENISGGSAISEENFSYSWMDETEILFSETASVWLKDIISIAENKRKSIGY